jgi:hypothetical protein
MIKGLAIRTKPLGSGAVDHVPRMREDPLGATASGRKWRQFRGRESGVRSQESGGSDQRAEGRGQRAEGRGQRAAISMQGSRQTKVEGREPSHWEVTRQITRTRDPERAARQKGKMKNEK